MAEVDCSVCGPHPFPGIRDEGCLEHSSNCPRKAVKLDDAGVTRGEVLKAIDRLVREGRAELTMVDGVPGIRLVKKQTPLPDDRPVVEPNTDGPVIRT